MAWRLRMVAAEHGVWTSAELARLMERKGGRTLSPASMSALMTKEPKEIKLETLALLCAALDCTPNDLLVVDRPSRTNTSGDMPDPFERIG